MKIIQGDCLEAMKTLDGQSVHCCVTSPPYFGLRDYGHDGQIGLEATPDAYVAKMVDVFREVRRVLRDDGTLWLNLGDSYSAGTNSPKSFRRDRAECHPRRVRKGTDCDPKRGAAATSQPFRAASGLPPKQLLGIPWRVAFALQADGWYLRQDIIWHKPNPMPESVRDRCTKAHEHIFLLSKSAKYYYDHEAIREPAACAGQMRGGSKARYEQNAAGMDCKIYNTRNRRSVWTVKPAVFKEAHFATFPPKLIEPCVLAGCPSGGTVLDPFSGAGTTGVVSIQHGRKYIGIELNPAYIAMTEQRINGESYTNNHIVDANKKAGEE